MKILIVGSDINAILTAEYIKLQDSENDIYMTTKESNESSCYTNLNIRENDINEICNFVKYNQIEFTIVTSKLAIINGIADTFSKEDFPIFAPFSEAARITFFNSIAKKILYKLKMNMPKFGIFDRENLAIDYIRKSKYPIIINNDFTLFERESSIHYTFPKAKIQLQKIFESGNEKIIIENYIDTPPIYMYFITDGYNALPLISIEKKNNDNYTELSAPSSKISEQKIHQILKNLIYPLLDDISKYAGNYTGILGIKLKFQKDVFFVLEFYNNFQDYDFQIFLSLFNDNLLNIMHDTATGKLSENYKCINTGNKYAYSIIMNKNQNQQENMSCDYIVLEDEKNVVYTTTASTLNMAKYLMVNYLEDISIKEQKVN